MNQQLWFNPYQSLYFIIPEAIDLPTGDLCLYTSTGETRWVEADSVTPWEVETLTEARAQLWQDLTAQVTDAWVAVSEAVETGKLTLNVTSSLGLKDLIAVINDLAQAINLTLAGDETSLKRATACLQRLRANIHQVGVELPTAIESWPQLYQQNLATEPQFRAQLESYAQQLAQIAAQIEHLQQGGLTVASEVIDSLIGIVKQSQPETPAQRKARYAKIASEAMPLIRVPTMEELLR